VTNFIRLAENATARNIPAAFVKEIKILHRLPTEIISVMDSKFAGEFWQSLCKKLGIKGKL